VQPCLPCRFSLVFLVLTLAGCRKGPETPVVCPSARLDSGWRRRRLDLQRRRRRGGRRPPGRRPRRPPHRRSRERTIFRGSAGHLRSGQGLLEPPISASVDEAEPLGGQPRRPLSDGTRGEGLPAVHRPGRAALRPGYTESPNITLVEAARKGNASSGTSRATPTAECSRTRTCGPTRGRTWEDGSGAAAARRLAEVNRYDLRNSNNGTTTRRGHHSMVYDHFQHPGTSTSARITA